MTNNSLKRLAWVSQLCVVLCLCVGLSSADNKATLETRLQQAGENSSLINPSLKPWHLKMTFQLFNAKGVATEQGTIEKWWKDSSTTKTIYRSPSYIGTVIRASGNLYRTKGMGEPPYLLELLLQQVVNPMPSATEVADSKPILYQKNAGKTALDCIMLSQTIKGVALLPIGLFPTYCLDRDGDHLRASFDSGSQMTARDRVGIFQQLEVAIDQTIAINGVRAATGHIEILETATMHDSDFAHSDDMEVADGKFLDVELKQLGQALTSVPPVYPENARRSRKEGDVNIRAEIGEDGHIRQMKLILSPDPEFAVSTLAAVRQWIYRPYLVNGKPAAVVTTITVHYRLGN